MAKSRDKYLTFSTDYTVYAVHEDHRARPTFSLLCEARNREIGLTKI